MPAMSETEEPATPEVVDSDAGGDDTVQEGSKAPIYQVPGEQIVSIEHPCIIRNFENGYKSLGGEAHLKHVLEHHVGDSKLSKKFELQEPVAGVSLRPNDPFAKKISSVGISTHNMLLKVTVPKRTGRKRKRGSDDPFEGPAQPAKDTISITAPGLLRRLQDNQNTYSVEPMGMMLETHRFRTLPDFQLRSTELPIMQVLRDHAMKPDYARLKAFKVDLSPGASSITAFPGPPSFTSIDMPFKYDYQQAHGVVIETDQYGNLRSKNITTSYTRLTWGLPPDAEEIPQGPPPELARTATGAILLRAIAELQALLEKRPLVTTRVAINSLPPISENVFRDATQHVGYGFKAGPFRDSLIKYGVDPRKDPKYRFYQTLMFQLDAEAFKMDPSQAKQANWARPLRHIQDKPESHVFDGKNITANGKTWQVCDVTDPVIRDIFQTEDFLDECDVFQWGWYHSGTLARARAIMKDKMRLLFAGETPLDEDYAPIAELPDRMDRTMLFRTSKKTPARIRAMMQDVRSCAKTDIAKYGGPSPAKRKSKGAAEAGDGDDDAMQVDDEVEADGGADEDGDGGGDDLEDGAGDFADLEEMIDREAAEAEENERAASAGAEDEDEP